MITGRGHTCPHTTPDPTDQPHSPRSTSTFSTTQ